MANLDFISNQALVDASGTPYAGAKVYYYETGTTTPKAVYSNAGLTSAHSQPVVADSNGVVPPVYLLAGRYKRVVTTSADVNLSQYAVDPLDASTQLIASASAPAATYAFLRYHNTTDGNVYRRNAANSAWINEGPVNSLISGATVSEVLTGTATDKAVTPDAVAGLWQRGTDIASASTLSLPAGGGGVFNVTGTTGITGISSAQGGRSIKLRFAGALTLTHNGTSFILPGSANITTVAGDTAEFINDAASDVSGSNWRCFNYETSDGRILPTAAAFATQAQQETASSTAVAVSPGRQQFHPSAPKAWVSFVARGTDGAATISSSYNVTSVTRSGAGTYIVTFTTAMSSATYCVVGTAQTTIGSNILVTSGSLATTTCNILCQSASAGSAQDVGTVHAIFLGDQ
jgi:hypothetical protein